MSSNDDKKRELEKKIKEGLQDAKPKRKTRKPSAPPVGNFTASGNIIYVASNGEASAGQLAGGDIHNHNYINEKKIVRPKVVRGKEYISPSCARKIQKRIETLVNMEMEAGQANKKNLFAKWHAMLKDHFNVPSYLEIPVSHEQNALDWLQQRKALLRPKIRRTSNGLWRNEHYTGIWTRSKELGMSKADVYDLVEKQLGKKVVSLKSLGERDLKQLYQMIFKLPKK